MLERRVSLQDLTKKIYNGGFREQGNPEKIFLDFWDKEEVFDSDAKYLLCLDPGEGPLGFLYQREY